MSESHPELSTDRWRAASAYLDQALDMPPDERERWLAALQTENPLVAADLRALLREHVAIRDEGFLEQPVLRRTLPPGTRLGPYEIISVLGAGSMGDVYRARDLVLNREVAIKTLPASFAQDTGRLARFKREAQVLAALNHSRIGAIYGFEESGAVQGLVLELVEGPTLANRIARGPIPPGEALAIAVQIAEALEAAHEQGIVHRDLKPANIKVRPDGDVKVLDFGLAKPIEPRIESSSDPILSPTITVAGLVGTEALLGTAAYMSPEQAKGRAADRRSDVWAFGCVLYEMLAAKRAFTGDDVIGTLAHVLLKEPDWTALPANTPAVIQRLLRRCLEKERRRRLDSMAAARLDLEEARTAPLAFGPPTAPGSRLAPEPAALGPAARSRSARWMTALLLACAITGLIVWRMSRPDRQPADALVFAVPEPENTSFSPSLGFLAVSPDGRLVAFVASSRQGANYTLWIRSLDSVASRPLAGTDGAVQPFWSPDSRFLAFNNTVDHRLEKIDVSSGLVQTVSELPSSHVGAWGRSGVILRPSAEGLQRIPVAGGAPRLATTLDRSRGETIHVYPQFLPDGRRFIYLARSTDRQYDGMVYIASLDSPARTAILKTDSHAEYAPPGYLLFVRGNTLVAQPFDAASIRIHGDPIPVAEQVERNFSNRRAAFSVSETGVLAYRQISETQLTWFDRGGRMLGAVGPPGRYTNPALAPDEQKVAVARMDRATSMRDIWTIELSRGALSRVTFDGVANQPIWSADGSQLAYLTRDGFARRASNGTGAPEPLQRAPSGDLLDWLPDGRALIYESPFTAKAAFGIWMLPLAGDRTPVPLVQRESFNVQGQVSPDGRWLAYASDESGRFEVSVQPFPAGTRTWRVSTKGGLEPHWRRDGRELFFLALDRTLMAAAVTTGATFEAEAPVPLFETKMSTLWNYTRNQYAAAHDGQRFLINQPAGQLPPITVVVNWARLSRASN